MARSLIANGKKENILQGLLLTGAFFFFCCYSARCNGAEPHRQREKREYSARPSVNRCIFFLREALVANGKKENILQGIGSKV
jgi:hypothetical protein